MDLLLPYSLLKEHLETEASFDEVCNALTLTGPTVDRVRDAGDDKVMEIEVITNRVDAASAYGIAREAAACLPEFGHKAEVKPLSVYEGEINGDENISVQILDQSLITKVMAVVIDDIKVAPSDNATVDLLEKMEIRAINNVVDITNELTARLGVPVHAFDFDKISQEKMIIRESNKGEQIKLLDGTTVKLAGKDIVIEDGNRRLIDLCGVMGGELSQIDENTSRVLLWVPIYEPRRIRRTSLYAQKRTLASQIFEKNPDKGIVESVLRMGVKMLIERASGKVNSKIWKFGEEIEMRSLPLSFDRVRTVLGQDLSDLEMTSILNRLGFEVSKGENKAMVTVPSYRLHDVEIEEDLIEEILRIYGYFRITPTIPTVNISELAPSPLLKKEIEIKKWLASRGFNEVMNYSLNNSKLYKDFGYDVEKLVKVTNPLSEDFEVMRPALLPGIVQSYEANIGKTKDIWLYELSNVYLANEDNDALPSEISSLCIISNNQDYKEFKGEIDLLLKKLGLMDITYSTDNRVGYSQVVALRYADKLIGYIGQLENRFLRQREVVTIPWIAEIELETVIAIENDKLGYKLLPKYTPVKLDLTIATDLLVGEAINKIKKSDSRIYSVSYLGSYQNKQSYSIEFYDPQEVLTIDIAKKTLGKIEEQFLL